ncbi:MAG: hypothetical protein AAFQ81_05650 [Pseudomonadota bacterium]
MFDITPFKARLKAVLINLVQAVSMASLVAVAGGTEVLTDLVKDWSSVRTADLIALIGSGSASLGSVIAAVADKNLKKGEGDE